MALKSLSPNTVMSDIQGDRISTPEFKEAHCLLLVPWARLKPCLPVQMLAEGASVSLPEDLLSDFRNREREVVMAAQVHGGLWK